MNDILKILLWVVFTIMFMVGVRTVVLLLIKWWKLKKDPMEYCVIVDDGESTHAWVHLNWAVAEELASLVSGIEGVTVDIQPMERRD